MVFPVSAKSTNGYSPFRVPVARLAAAQAAIEEKRAAAKAKPAGKAKKK